MRYFMSVLDSAATPATGDEMAAIDAFNDAMAAKNQRIMAVGMEHPSTAAVYDNRHDQGEVTPGTYVQQDETIMGFWVIEVDSEATAQELAAQASKACNRRIELRRLHG
jgi:hypothetical protein